MKTARKAKRTVKARARKPAASRQAKSASSGRVKASKRAKKPASGGARKAAPKRGARKSTRKPAAKQTNLIVVTSGERPVHEIAGELRKAGFAVDQVLDQINPVTGRAPAAAAQRLKSIRGVTDVSPEHPPFSIGPPDAPVS